MFTIFHSEGPIKSWDQAAQANRESYASVFHALLNAGIYTAPSQFEASFVSTAHNESHVDEFLNALRASLKN